jgi:hypothetical protein
VRRALPVSACGCGKGERGWAGRGRAGVDSYGAGSDGNAPPACSYLRACTVCLPPAALGRGDGAVAIIILPARRLKAHQLVKF